MPLSKISSGAVGTLSNGLTLTSDDPTITMTDSSGTDDIVTIQSTSGAVIITARDGSSDGEIIFKKTDGSTTDETMRIESSGDKVFKGSSSNYDAQISQYGQLIGGIGAVSTAGTTDWNDATNARSGCGQTLLLGTHSNGPGGSYYFHPFTFEYNQKTGGGNMTQLAFSYHSNNRYMRYRYGGSWSSWSSF